MAGSATVGRRRRPWTWRATNLRLLAALVLALATGVGAVATGSARGGWVAVAHGVAGLAVVALVPWKRRVVAVGLRRRRPDRWASLALAGLTLGCLALGVVSATGVATGAARAVAGQEPLWAHIALALLLVPLLAWHVAGRPVHPRTPRRADLTRRALVGSGLVAVAGGAAWGAVETVTRLADLPGARRRFTGSHAVADPAAMPVTSWLDDAVPAVDRAAWRVRVTDAAGPRVLSPGDLRAVGTATVTATLDCTSGWYATREWTGVPLAALLRPAPGDRSVRVRSVTGYERLLPLADLDTLLLGVAYDGRALAAGHGAPVRLVAPGRRGFWWVKWVVAVETSRRPWWAQAPFPPT